MGGFSQSDMPMTVPRLQIRALAQDVFGDPETADLWLNEGLPILGGKTPSETAHSLEGALVVARILAKIDWGAAA
jgi:uncharacterized protein (DUF2384 family)